MVTNMDMDMDMDFEFVDGKEFSFGSKSPDHDFEFDRTSFGTGTPSITSWCSSPDNMFSEESNSSFPSLASDLLKGNVIYGSTHKNSNYDQEKIGSQMLGIRRNLFGPASGKRTPLGDVNQNISRNLVGAKRTRKLKTWNGGASKKTIENFQRSQSQNEMNIKHALEYDEENPDLIGDFSAPYVLPLVRHGKHEDLKAVSHETLKNLLDGHYSHLVDKYFVIDCRYPYEFDGGHIIGAQNLYTSDGIVKEFLSENVKVQSGQPNSKRQILIFHCEFSSERGPKLLRFLRKMDRQLNENSYPSLVHPEIYLLENGYKEFHENQPQHCRPGGYRPMLHPDHASEMVKYRTKSFGQSRRKNTRLEPSNKRFKSLVLDG